MRLVVFGSANLLGSVVCKLAEADSHEINRATRMEVDYGSLDSLYNYLKKLSSINNIDAIINCATLSPTRASNVNIVLINSFFPHLLAAVTSSLGIRVIQCSSDAVFSGHSKYLYTPRSNTDPTTYYGKSLAMGEIIAPNHCVVRASYISERSGMVRWLLDQPPGATVEGWANYKYTVTGVDEVAKAILELVSPEKFTPSIQHVAPVQATSKYEIVCLLVKHLGLDIEVKQVFHPWVNRVLDATIIVPSLEESLINNPIVVSGVTNA